MKSVLSSTRPKWCEKICHEIGTDKNGKPIYEKSIEVRKTKPSIPTPFRVYIYETKSRDNTIYKRYKVDDIRSGKVIGEFVCDKVMFLTPLGLRGFEMREEILKSICLTNDDLNAYGGLKTLYGWHISQLKIYDKPKELKDFLLPCGGKICWGCNLLNVKEADCINRGKRYATRPPQSWCYVQELEDA